MTVPPVTRPHLHQLLGDAKAQYVGEAHRRIAAAGYAGIGGNGIAFRWLAAGGTRLSEMVECSGMTKQAFGEHVASLEAAGYVQRLPDPADGRAKVVVPTPLGLEAMACAQAVFAELEAEWAEEVGAEDLAMVRAVLERIAAR